MTEILYGKLYLAGIDEITQEFLISNNIKYIINVAKECTYELIDLPDVEVKKFNIVDDFIDIYDYFPVINNLINENLTKGSVLVHCMRGLSRSPAMIIAYLICEHRMPLLEAVRYLRSKRTILPNPHFMRELMKLEANVLGTYSFDNIIDDYVVKYIICYFEYDKNTFNISL